MQQREAKFRAMFKNMDTGRNVWITIGVNERYDQPGWAQVSPWVQYTGLKDRNGREIYEGDLIQEVYEESECGPAVTFVVPVVFMDGAFCIEDGDPLFELDAMNDHNWSAVGNIYENPELLK